MYEEMYGTQKGKRDGDDDEHDWRRLTPFKTNMQHQRRIMEMQMDLAIELGVNASVHSVAAPGMFSAYGFRLGWSIEAITGTAELRTGATLDVLVGLRKKHGPRFSRSNICIHSAGGWSPEFWRSAAIQLPHNLYGSPSILITSRVSHAEDLIRVIHRDRILVESDSHDIKQMTRLLWGAAEWVSRVRGWKLENGSEEWEMEREQVDVYGPDGREQEVPDEEVWTVRTLEGNWARFMRLVD
jgi:Tat protein secretion system quality control protein TatD with DNase activity